MNDYRVQPTEVAQLERRASALYPLPARLSGLALVALAIGAVGFGVGLAVAPGRAWAALLANWLFWTGLCAASLVVAATFNIVGAWWGRVIQRVLTGLAAFLPFSVIPLLALWFGREHIFPWLTVDHHNPWLDAGPLFARNLAMLVVFIVVGMVYMKHMLRLDVGTLVEEGRIPREGLAARLSANWRGADVESRRSAGGQRTLAPIVILLYVLVFSFLSVDFEMSQTSHFRSTMYPVIYFIGCYYAAWAAAAILVALWRRVEPLQSLLVGPGIRDLGNMMWGAAIFFGYVLWCQYFVFWMGNLPHEAGWHIARWRTMPWAILSWAMLASGFIIPFFVLFARGVKQSPRALASVAVLSLLGVFLCRFFNIYPSLPDLGPSTLGLVEAAITVGFLGAVALPYLWLMRRVPPFPVEDPLFFRTLAARGVEV